MRASPSDATLMDALLIFQTTQGIWTFLWQIFLDNKSMHFFEFEMARDKHPVCERVLGKRKGSGRKGRAGGQGDEADE